MEEALTVVHLRMLRLLSPLHERMFTHGKGSREANMCFEKSAEALVATRQRKIEPNSQQAETR